MRDDVDDVAWAGRARYDGRYTSGGGEARGDDFGRHAASTERGAGGGDVGFEGADVGDYFYWLGVWVRAGVFGVEAVDVGQ